MLLKHMVERVQRTSERQSFIRRVMLALCKKRNNAILRFLLCPSCVRPSLSYARAQRGIFRVGKIR